MTRDKSWKPLFGVKEVNRKHQKRLIKRHRDSINEEYRMIREADGSSNVLRPIGFGSHDTNSD